MDLTLRINPITWIIPCDDRLHRTMGVIEERAVLMQCKFIGEGAAWWDRFLRDVVNSIHGNR